MALVMTITYEPFLQVTRKRGFFDAVRYKVLEARMNYPWLNELLAIPAGESQYWNGLGITAYDTKGRLTHFNPNPEATIHDFIGIGRETGRIGPPELQTPSSKFGQRVAKLIAEEENNNNNNNNTGELEVKLS